MYVVILANNLAEANRHVKRQGLRRGTYRFAARAATVRKLRVGEIHVLPGFRKRFDKHAILNEVRFTRGKRRVFNECGVEGQCYPLERAAEVAFRYEAIRESTRQQALAEFAEKELIGGEPARAPEPSEDPAPAPRRRKAAAKPAPAVADGFF